MRHILVTWNPGPDNDEQYTPEQWKDEVADPLSPGGLVIEGSWDVGGRTQGIDPGDFYAPPGTFPAAPAP